MASKYWKYVFVNVTPEKFKTLSDRVSSSKPSDTTVYSEGFDAGTVTIGFGGDSITETKAWFESQIISDLGLEVSVSESTVANDVCITSKDEGT